MITVRGAAKGEVTWRPVAAPRRDLAWYRAAATGRGEAVTPPHPARVVALRWRSTSAESSGSIRPRLPATTRDAGLAAEDRAGSVRS